ncbi:MAG: hypothetical protein HY738_09080 [Bacteroidia bacterium]|nr:hypothetical protein [Bacteroidia bacterium]
MIWITLLLVNLWCKNRFLTSFGMTGNNFSVGWIGRDVETLHATSLHSLLKRISKVLGYDFFLYFIPEEKMKISLEKHPEYGTTISQPANIQNLQKEIESLNKEINQLKELVKAKDEIINLLKSHKG